MRFRRSNGGVFEFSQPALAILASHRQLSASAAEAGGVLLGRFIVSSQDVVVDEVTSPTRYDKRWRFFFKRAKRSAQARVEEAWRESQGTRNYLGDWHSHPEDNPTPSCIDTRGWKKTLRKAHVESEALFFVILGRTTVRVWEGTVAGQVITEVLHIAEGPDP